MAFFSKVGNILKQTATKHINSELSASKPSIFQAIRCMSSSKLFVGGISFNTDEQSLKEVFSNYGEVIEARIIMDRETGRSRGFGFVTYTTSEEASSAIQALDGKDLHGRNVRVNYATDRARTGGFGGGYGGGGYGGGGYGGGGGGYGGGGDRGYGGGGNYSSGGGGNYSGGGGGGGNYSGGGGGNYSGGGGYGDGGNYNSGGGGGYSSANNSFDAGSIGSNFGGPGGASGNDVYPSGGGSGGSASDGFGTGVGPTGGDQFGVNESSGLEENFRDDVDAPDDFAKRA